MAVGGSGSVLSRKIFRNLHAVMAIIILFEQFLRKFYLNFLPLNLSVSPNIMYFVCTFSIMSALGVRLIVIEKVRNYVEVVFIKNMFQSNWCGMHPPTPPLDPPLPALITMSLNMTPTSRLASA